MKRIALNPTPWTIPLFLMALLLVTPALAGDDGSSETMKVEKGVRLELECHAGYVFVRAWDRDEVKVVAEHGPRDEVRLRRLGDVLSVQPSSHKGKPSVIDFEISAPAWMPLSISGNQLDVDVEGIDSEIEIEVVSGEIGVVGGRESVFLRSVQGSIEVEDAHGEIDVGSSNEAVRLLDCEGSILAETLNGDLRLEGIVSSSVEGVTLNGDIFYDGSMDADGDYYFATHSGDVELSVPDSADLTVTIANVDGDFNCDFDVQLLDTRPGKRFKFVLGEGSGRLRVESFSGDIDLFDPKGGRRKRGR